MVDMNTLVTANKFHHFYKRIFIGCKLFIINHLRKFMVNTARGGTGKTSTMYQVIFWEPGEHNRKGPLCHFVLLAATSIISQLITDEIIIVTVTGLRLSPAQGVSVKHLSVQLQSSDQR